TASRKREPELSSRATPSPTASCNTTVAIDNFSWTCSEFKKSPVGHQCAVIADRIGEVGGAVRMDRVERGQARDDEVNCRSQSYRAKDEEGGKEPEGEGAPLLPPPIGESCARPAIVGSPFDRARLNRQTLILEFDAR